MAKFRNVLTPFFHSIDAVLKASWGEGWGSFSQAYPPARDVARMKLPIITYRIRNKTPGVLGPSGTRERKPRERRITEASNNPQDGISTWGQKMEAKIRFTCWSQSLADSWELAEQFEEFMMRTSGIFMREIPNILQIWYEGTESDSPETNRWRVDLFASHVDYQVSIDQRISIRSHVMESLEVVVREVIDSYEGLLDHYDSRASE